MITSGLRLSFRRLIAQSVAFVVLTVDDWPSGMYAYQNTGVLDRLIGLKRAPPYLTFLYGRYYVV